MSVLRPAVVVAVALSCSVAHADYIDHFANPDDIGLLKVPRFGTTKVLVIPVIIEDQPFQQGSEQAFLDELDAFYDPNAEGWAFTPYWEATSLGRFRPEATVANPVRFAACPPLGAHEDCRIPRGAGLAEGDTQGAVQVLVDAFDFLDVIFRCASEGPTGDCEGGGGVDFSAFDTSGVEQGVPDDVVDGVIVVSNAGFPGIALPVKDLSNNDLIGLFGPFPEFIYDDTLVPAAAISGNVNAAFVSVHEFGHLMGWCDLYNEAGTTTDMPYTLMGGWFYQDPGSLPDAYSRAAAGFAHVVQVAGDGTFTLRPADESGTVLKVGTGNEFFMVELRRKVEGALDGDLTEPFGVVVERVRLQQRPSPEQGRYFGTLQDCVNCTPFDTFLSIEQADGRFELENRFPRDDDEDLFQAGNEIAPSDDTEPRTLENQVFSTNRYDGSKTDITIRVVDVTSTSATIEIEAPAVDDPCAEIGAFCQIEACALRDDGAGECGAVPVPDDVIPPIEGCTCATSSPLGLGGFAAAGLALLTLRRRRR
jgi:MYXO-CTERM domain-containing protein